MIIEITGAAFTNKGAELMLATVCDRLRKNISDVKLCIPLSFAFFEGQQKYKLYYSIPVPDYRTVPSLLINDMRTFIKNFRTRASIYKTRHLLNNAIYHNLASRRLGAELGLIKMDEVDVLVDISGFAFGDKGSAEFTHEFAQKALSFKRKNKPVIMLPQMLGPFTRPGQPEAFAKLGEYVDIIYAREQESFEHAEPLVKNGKLKIAPDITIPTSPIEWQKPSEPYICVVPNSKMLQENPQGQDWKGIYLIRLQNLCLHLQNLGFTIVIVQHENGSGDSEIVCALSSNLDSSEVVKDLDPQVLKGVLGSATLVIGSRFHALVSSLSMGVPSIALGWAHKYDFLMHDFGVPELIHYARNPESHLIDLIDDTLENRARIAEVIGMNKKILGGQVEKMWEEVFTKIN